MRAQQLRIVQGNAFFQFVPSEDHLSEP
jgi:hypothetical protein